MLMNKRWQVAQREKLDLIMYQNEVAGFTQKR
ncbi:hypothetical protein OA78_0195 [Latilactobacillus curvatus]|nr:hypothetical protein OA78_0195 [Latilactobacillus curvatus]